MRRRALNTLRGALAALAWAIPLLPAAAQELTLTVQDIIVSDSAYLTDAEITAITGRYENRPLTFDDLMTLTRDFNAAYLERGIVTAQAVLPPQEIENGTLRVDLVEATVDAVAVDGFAYTDPGFLRRAVTLQGGSVPDYDALERDLLLYRLAHGYPLRTEFAPGATTGTTRVTLTAEEPARLGYGFAIGNGGSPDTGEVELTVGLTARGLTGRPDVLNIDATRSEGRDAVQLGWSVPISTRGDRVALALSASQAEVIAGSFVAAQLTSSSRAVSLGWSRPIILNHEAHLRLSLAAAWETAETRVAGFGVSDAEYRDLQGGISYALTRPGLTVAATYGLTLGRADTKQVTASEGNYVLHTAALSYAKAIGSIAAVSLRAAGQYSPEDLLPGARLFSLGGQGSVRGYPASTRAAGNGATLTAEIEPLTPLGPVALPGGFDLRVTPYAFGDAGWVDLPRGAGAAPVDTLVSAGLGLRAQLSDSTFASVEVAFPQTRVANLPGSRDPHFTFSLGARF